MSLRYTIPAHHDPSAGKFRSHRRLGTQASGEEVIGGWTFQLIEHHTGTTVKRTVYNVAVTDPRGNRAAYLTDFASIEQAATAARAWIAERRNG